MCLCWDSTQSTVKMQPKLWFIHWFPQKKAVSDWNLTIFFRRIYSGFFFFLSSYLGIFRFRMSSTANSEVNIKLERAVLWDRDHRQGCLSLRSCLSLLALLRTVDALSPRLDRPNHKAGDQRRAAARNLLLSSDSHSSSPGSRSGTQTSRPAARKTWTSWDGFLSVPSSCIAWPCIHTWGHLSVHVKTDWRLKDEHVDAAQVGVAVWKWREMQKCSQEKVPLVHISSHLFWSVVLMQI